MIDGLDGRQHCTEVAREKSDAALALETTKTGGIISMSAERLGRCQGSRSKGERSTSTRGLDSSPLSNRR